MSARARALAQAHRGSQVSLFTGAGCRVQGTGMYGYVVYDVQVLRTRTMYLVCCMYLVCNTGMYLVLCPCTYIVQVLQVRRYYVPLYIVHTSR